MDFDRRAFLQVLSGQPLSAGMLLETYAASPAPEPIAPTDRDSTAFLLNRIAFGATPALYARVHDVGAATYIEEQLNPDDIDDSELERRMAPYAAWNSTPAQLLDTRRGDVLNDLILGWITRALYTERQLHERMVHFWSDHFSVYIGKGGVGQLKIADDRDHIRPHALGRFRDLLGASAKSPAMLFYLDQAQSNAIAPNENYGRELLELHTLGVDGGYTEDDVKAAARAFTGWSIYRPQDDTERGGTFLFRPRLHDDGDKVFLGDTIRGGGIEEGERILDILAAHPSTARFISTKLARRFVSDNPPAALVDDLSQTFLQTDGDIRAVMQTLLASDAFWSAPPKFKRPFEYAVGVLRHTDYHANNMQPLFRELRQTLDALGQMPFSWPAPNGYPDVGAYWMANLLPRWNYAVQIVDGARMGGPDLDTLRAMPGESAAGIPTTYLIGGGLPPTVAETIEEFAKRFDIPDQSAAALALLLASPAYQYK